MRFISIVICLFVALLVSCATTKTKQSEAKSEQKAAQKNAVNTATILKTQLKKDYQVIPSAKNLEARYCPENSCDVMKAPETVTPEVLNDFAFMYLGRHSKYERAKKFQKTIPDAEVAQIVGKYKDLCSDPQATTKCVLKGLQKKYSIRLMSLQYDDEGTEKVAPQNIE